jgi:hypothetical protein
MGHLNCHDAGGVVGNTGPPLKGSRREFQRAIEWESAGQVTEYYDGPRDVTCPVIGLNSHTHIKELHSRNTIMRLIGGGREVVFPAPSLGAG